MQHTRLQIHQHSAGDIATTSSLVEVDVDALQLEIGITVVGTSGIHAVLVRDDFPELGTDLEKETKQGKKRDSRTRICK